MIMNKNSLRIAMLGHKRMPSHEGGIEIVVEELATRMVKLGHRVTCYNRMGHHVIPYFRRAYPQIDIPFIFPHNFHALDGGMEDNPVEVIDEKQVAAFANVDRDAFLEILVPQYLLQIIFTLIFHEPARLDRQVECIVFL